MTTDAMRIGTGHDHVRDAFFTHLAAMPAPVVLELGTRRWDAAFPTHHRDEVPHAGAYVMSDATDGLDVDVVADAHDLAPFTDGAFDAVIAVSVWEHLALPWIAAQALARVLRPGGVAYIGTHHTFPQHGYPADFTRWDVRGLESMMSWAGLDTVVSSFLYPCQIIPPPEVTRWNRAAPAWLNVNIYVTKPT